MIRAFGSKWTLSSGQAGCSRLKYWFRNFDVGQRVNRAVLEISSSWQTRTHTLKNMKPGSRIAVLDFPLNISYRSVFLLAVRQPSVATP